MKLLSLFDGEGGFPLAAYELNRPSYGFEIDKAFFEKATNEMIKPIKDTISLDFDPYDPRKRYEAKQLGLDVSE